MSCEKFTRFPLLKVEEDTLYQGYADARSPCPGFQGPEGFFRDSRTGPQSGFFVRESGVRLLMNFE